jgi:hypothetical protein
VRLAWWYSGVWNFQTFDQLRELIERRKYLRFFDLVRRKVRAPSRIGRHVSVLRSGNEDGAQPPLQILEGLKSLAFVCPLVEECLYCFDRDLRQLHVAERRKVVGPDIGLIAVHRRPLLVRQLQRAVLFDKTAKSHHLFRLALDIVNGFENRGQLFAGQPSPKRFSSPNQD